MPMSNEIGEIKMYSDYKSPYAYLAFEPAYELAEKHGVRLRWIPFHLRLKGKGERSIYSEFKVKYSYLDARRWANKSGGIVLKGPIRVYDSTAALIGGLFADLHGKLLEYSRHVYAAFFRRELEIDQPEAVADVIGRIGLSADDYRLYLADEGARRFEQAQAEALADEVFGVPFFMFGGESFWGYDRLLLLKEKLELTDMDRAMSGLRRR
jgi:2-hydroxychromene-2-carboxylate isomerase